MERYDCSRCQLNKPETDFSELARAQARANYPHAMCQECIDRAWHSRLSRREALAYLEEDTYRLEERQRLPGQEERKNKSIRWGRGLHHSELIRRLRQLLPTLYVQQGNIPGDLSLYDIDHGYVRYLCYIHEGWSPEYTIVHVNERNLPEREQRGWRTVLLRLIKGGYITEEQAQLAFGDPTNGNAARFYREELFNYRNHRWTGN